MNTVTATSSTKNRRLVKGVTQVALFAALIILMAFTPFLGYIPLGFTRATTLHIPVILASLLLGPKKGALLGGVFGMTSLINATVNPTPASFVFSPFYSLGEFSGGWESLVICFIPRILIGIVPWFVYRAVQSVQKKSGVSPTGLVLSGIAGSLTNTLLVMNLIFLFFRDSYAAVNEVSASAVYGFILSVIGINGVPEAIVAGILVLLIGRVLMRKSVKQRLGIE